MQTRDLTLACSAQATPQAARSEGALAGLPVLAAQRYAPRAARALPNAQLAEAYLR